MNMDPLPWVRCVCVCWRAAGLFVPLPPYDCLSPGACVCLCVWQIAASVWPPPPCICMNLHSSGLWMPRVCDASEWELHAACSLVWKRGGGGGGGGERERGQQRWREGEEEEGGWKQKETVGGGVDGFCLHREISKDNPGTSARWWSAAAVMLWWMRWKRKWTEGEAGFYLTPLTGNWGGLN